MLDFSAYNIRKFEVKLGEKKLNLLPPKLSQVDLINEFTRKFYTEGASSGEMAEMSALILNRNDSGEQFAKEHTCELEYDVVYSIIFEYIAWVNEIHTSPNSVSPPAEI